MIGGVTLSNPVPANPAPVRFQGQDTGRVKKKTTTTGRFVRAGEKLYTKGERFVRRKAGAKMAERFGPVIDEIHRQMQETDRSDPRFLELIKAAGALLIQNRNIEGEINTENGELDAIVDSDEAVIFVMNHNYQKEDPALLGLFAIRLYNEYLERGKDDCPRPRIILNEDIINCMPDKIREVYEGLGAAPVDASFSRIGKTDNKRVMAGLMREFNNDQSHIFIFPEGKMSAFKSLDLKRKFFPGIGRMVQSAAKKKSRVKVVPLGFAYDKNKEEGQPLGSVFIGKPVYFRLNDDGHLMVNTGNITPENANSNYRGFFWNVPEPAVYRDGLVARMANAFSYKEPKPIPADQVATEDGVTYFSLVDKGQPVTGEEASVMAADVIAENLIKCITGAWEQMPDSAGDEEQINYVS